MEDLIKTTNTSKYQMSQLILKTSMSQIQA